ncbi:hypothetical protein COA23_14030 [Priestia megaterium]|nr:hypothetical protein CN397_01430 [Priestia megaterium]PGR06098.1 hypothetical protein COA23_14030 [Priestia megaterium]PGY54549.1 hypothetical protein COE35_06015 [Priestia megaterium]
MHLLPLYHNKSSFQLIFVITLLIEAGLTYACSSFLSIRFIELMFFSGLLFSVLTFWFSSSGSNSTHSHYKTHSMRLMSGATIEHNPFRLRWTAYFFASLSFTGMVLIFFVLLLTDVIPPVS